MACPNSFVIAKVKKFIESHFKLKDIGDLKFFFCIEIARSSYGFVVFKTIYAL